MTDQPAILTLRQRVAELTAERQELRRQISVLRAALDEIHIRSGQAIGYHNSRPGLDINPYT